jgi:hypothetical protein
MAIGFLLEFGDLDNRTRFNSGGTYKEYTMSWAPDWVGVSGGVAAPGTSVTAIARYPQHLDAFCVGSDLGIYSTWWDISTAADGWAGWFRVAGGVAAPGTPITVVARNPNHLDLFAIGSDHGIYSIWWDANGGWAGSWFNVSGGVAAPGTSITALTRNPNHIDLFAIGSDHGIYSVWWDAATGWANWFQIAGGVAAPNSSVAAVARYPTHMDLFAIGTDHRIYSIWWDQTARLLRYAFGLVTSPDHRKTVPEGPQMSLSKAKRKINMREALRLIMDDLDQPFDWQEHDSKEGKFLGIHRTTVGRTDQPRIGQSNDLRPLHPHAAWVD